MRPNEYLETTNIFINELPKINLKNNKMFLLFLQNNLQNSENIFDFSIVDSDKIIKEYQLIFELIKPILFKIHILKSNDLLKLKKKNQRIFYSTWYYFLRLLPNGNIEQWINFIEKQQVGSKLKAIHKKQIKNLLIENFPYQSLFQFIMLDKIFTQSNYNVGKYSLNIPLLFAFYVSIFNNHELFFQSLSEQKLNIFEVKHNYEKALMFNNDSNDEYIIHVLSLLEFMMDYGEENDFIQLDYTQNAQALYDYMNNNFENKLSNKWFSNQIFMKENNDDTMFKYLYNCCQFYDLSKYNASSNEQSSLTHELILVRYIKNSFDRIFKVASQSLTLCKYDF